MTPQQLAHREQLRGLPFTKMSGSGNDFVFFDGRVVDRETVTSPEVIRAICSRHNGIGADGVVVLEAMHTLRHVETPATASGASGHVDARIHYFNSDGTPADLCGNATLCSTVMAAHLGISSADGMGLDTPSGRIASRIAISGIPEIDLQPVSAVVSDIAIPLERGEQRIGFAIAGVPHLVLVCDDVDLVPLESRGPILRRHAASGEPGANVNWVSANSDGSWRYRTFERGVEGETLACGTGAVATAILLSTWGLATSPITIRTSSNKQLVVRLDHRGDQWFPTLRGEGRMVFQGAIGELNL